METAASQSDRVPPRVLLCVRSRHPSPKRGCMAQFSPYLNVRKERRGFVRTGTGRLLDLGDVDESPHLVSLLAVPQ